MAATSSSNPFFDAIAPMSDEAYENLLLVLQKPKPSRDELVKSVAASVPDLSFRAAGEMVDVATGLATGAVATRATPARSQQVLSSYARRFYSDGVPAGLIERAQRAIAAPAFLVLARVTAARQDRGQNIANVSLAMDLTPVHGADDQPLFLVPSFTLGIDQFSSSGNETRRTDFTLDETDVRELARRLDAVLEGLAQMRATLGSTNLTLWEEPEGEETDDADS